MTPKERAAMQQALEALVEADKYYDYGAIITALPVGTPQDSVGRNVSFADETVCNWRQPTYDHSDANYWDADCGKSWAITEGTPTENGMKFCHGCGKPIKEHPFVDSEDEQ